MGHPRLSDEEIVRRGEELYKQKLQAKVETDENIGKVIVFDVGTGDYEIGDHALQAADRLRAKSADAVPYAKRIGYDAVYTLSGRLR